MRRRVLGMALVALVVGGLASYGWVRYKRSSDIGYVEIRTVPVTAPTPVSLFIDAVKLDPLHKGSTVLKQNVGTHKLGLATSGDPTTLCEVVIKRDRITTVTVSLLDRPPRCQCRAAAGTDAASNKSCSG